MLAPTAKRKMSVKTFPLKIQMHLPNLIFWKWTFFAFFELDPTSKQFLNFSKCIRKVYPLTMRFYQHQNPNPFPPVLLKRVVNHNVICFRGVKYVVLGRRNRPKLFCNLLIRHWVIFGSLKLCLRFI